MRAFLLRRTTAQGLVRGHWLLSAENFDKWMDSSRTLAAFRRKLQQLNGEFTDVLEFLNVCEYFALLNSAKMSDLWHLKNI